MSYVGLRPKQTYKSATRSKKEIISQETSIDLPNICMTVNVYRGGGKDRDPPPIYQYVLYSPADSD